MAASLPDKSNILLRSHRRHLPARLQSRNIRHLRRNVTGTSISSQSDNELYREFVLYSGNAYCSNLAIGAKVASDGKVLWKAGDGNTVQRVYIAYSKTYGIIINYQGTNTTSKESIANDVSFQLEAPWKGLRWLGPQVEIGKGFQGAWNDTADEVSNQVLLARKCHPNAPIVCTGHSLGATLALLEALHLTHTLNTTVRAIVFGMPRTGNKHFADAVDRYLPYQNHIVRFQDPVPHLPSQGLGFQHPSGEVYIANSKGNLVYQCAGQENSLCSDSISLFDFNADDHRGPYFGKSMKCEFNE